MTDRATLKLRDRLPRKPSSATDAVLHHLSNRIAAALSREELLPILLHDLPKELQLTRTGLLLNNGRYLELTPQAAGSEAICRPDSSLPALLQQTSRCLLLNRPHPAIVHEQRELLEAGYLLALPLPCPSAPGSALLAGARCDGCNFSRRGLNTLATLCNQAGIAFENAARCQALLESREQIEELYRQRVQQEKLAMIGEMTASIAHELKNPLGIITSSAQFLQNGPHPPEIEQELLGYIIAEVEQLNFSIRSLLGLVRQGVPQLAPVHLADALPALLRLWQQSERHNPTVDLRLSLQPHLPILHCDLQQLRQVLFNLVCNSEQMMPEGGTITVEAEAAYRQIILRVIDSGTGIASDIADKLFTRLYSTRREGNGLGLAICWQIVQAHNGAIRLYNGPHGGAIAEVTLPEKPLTITEMAVENHTSDNAVHPHGDP